MTLKKEIVTNPYSKRLNSFSARNVFEWESSQSPKFPINMNFSFSNLKSIFFPQKGTKRLIFEMEIPFAKMIVEEEQNRQWVFREIREFKTLSIEGGEGNTELSDWIKKQIDEFKDQLAEYPRVVWLGKGIYTFRADVPLIAKAKWREQFVWQAAEKLPFAVEEAEIFYEKDSEGVCVVASEPERIEKTFSAFHEKDICVFVLTSLALSYQQCFKYRMINANHCVLIAHLGEKQSSLIIFNKGKFFWARDLSIGFCHFAEAMAGTLATNDKQEVFSYEEAVSFLKKRGLPTPDLMPASESPRESQLASRVRPVFEKLTYEIRSSIAQFHLEYPAVLVEKILFGGEGAQLPGLAPYIQNQMLLPAESLIEKSSLEFPSEALAAHGAGYLNASSLNAAPARDRLSCLMASGKTWMIRLSLAMGILILASSLAMLLQIGAALNQKNNLRKDLSRIVSDPQKIETSEQLYKMIEEREQFLAAWVPAQPDWGHSLRVLSRIVPSPVTLTKVAFDRKTGKIILLGSVKQSQQNQDAVLANFLTELNRTGVFKNSTLEARTLMESNPEAVIFTIQTELSK